MADDTGDPGLAHGTDLPVQALNQVEAAGEQFPPPALVPDAVLPEVGAGKRRLGVRSVAHEAANGVGVEAKEERDKQVVGVPEGLEGLLPDAVVGRRVHEQHAEEHNVSGDTSGLRIVDLDRRGRPDLGPLNIVEAGHKLAEFWLLFARRRDAGHILHVVRRDVDNGEKEHGVRDLTVKPEVLVQRQKPDLRPDRPHKRAAYRQQDERAVESEDETGTSGEPHGPFQRV